MEMEQTDNSWGEVGVGVWEEMYYYVVPMDVSSGVVRA